MLNLDAEEVRTLAGPHFRFRGDQLADEMLVELGPRRGGLEILVAVDELERVRIEQRELLFDGDGEVRAALERLARALSAQGSLNQAIAYAQRWLSLDPLHEAALRLLMLLYTWLDERGAALRQYRECVSVLQKELGVAPLAETTELAEAIKENRVPASPSAATVVRLPFASPARREPQPHKPFPRCWTWTCTAPAPMFLASTRSALG